MSYSSSCNSNCRRIRDVHLRRSCWNEILIASHETLHANQSFDYGSSRLLNKLFEVFWELNDNK
uniref:Uncharacterized protein n=1 Tax=Glossina pallidipes TaxID=7398 RepID=A0A1A9ZMT2_GLOPL